jgi:hypothetical protein
MDDVAVCEVVVVAIQSAAAARHFRRRLYCPFPSKLARAHPAWHTGDLRIVIGGRGGIVIVVGGSGDEYGSVHVAIVLAAADAHDGSQN